MSVSKHLTLSVFIWLTVLTLSACGGGSNNATNPTNTIGTTSQKTLVSISVSTDNPSLTTSTNATIILTATYDDNTSEQILATDVIWSVDNAQVATIDSEGVVQTGIYVSDIVITANYLGQSKQVTLSIAPAQSATISNVAFDPTVDLTQLSITTYVVEASYSDGSINQSLTVQVQDNSDPQNLKLLIESEPFSAAISSTGGTQTLAVSPPTTVTVAAEVTLASVVILGNNNLKRGDVISLTATANFSDQTQVDVTTLATWSSTDSSVAQINANTVTAGNTTGATSITASYLGMEATVTINLLPITGLNITGPSSIRIKESLTLVAADRSGNNISPSATWDSSNTLIVNVNANGTITAGSTIGTATISATMDGKTNIFDVSFLTPDTVTINTPTNALQINTSYPLSVTASYADNYSVDISQNVTWASDTTTVATIAADTLQTYAIVDTTAVITGNAYGKTFQQDVIVAGTNNATNTLSNITFDETSVAMLPGDSYTPKLKATYSDSSQVYLSLNVTWSSDNDTVASVNSITGRITAQAIVANSSTAIITATFESKTANITINVSQPETFDFLSYQIGASQPQSRIENNATFPIVSVKSFYNPSGLLLDMPMLPTSISPAITPFSGQFITMSHGQEKFSINLQAAANIAVVGDFDKTNAVISFMPNINAPIYYSIDNTANTNVAVSLTSIDAAGKAQGTFTAVLCNNAAIANNGCDSALNTITVTGSFAATIEADKNYNCYSSTSPKIIDALTLHSYQEICAGQTSYYQLNSSTGLEYKIDIDATGASVEATVNNATSTASANIQSLTFTANSNTTLIALNNTGLSANAGTTFKLDITPLTASPQGTTDLPFIFNNKVAPFKENYSVDNTASYYRFPVSAGHSYKLSINTKNTGGSGVPVLSATSKASGFNTLDLCNNFLCEIINAETDFIYAKIDGVPNGASNGFAVGFIELKYKTDRDPNNNLEALTLPLSTTGFKGQTGEKELGGDGSINTLQGSLYWIVGMDASKNYIVTISGVDKYTQLWVNGIGMPCSSAGDETTPSFSCYIDNHYGQMAISVSTLNNNGTKYTLDITETTDGIYFVSTFPNDKTWDSSFDKTGLSVFRAGSDNPIGRSISNFSTFSTTSFSAASGETVYIKVNDPYKSGNYYSLIINKTGSTPPIGGRPDAPDAFEPADDDIDGATPIYLNAFDANSHHSLIDINGNTGDIDWFKFTAP